MKRLVILLVLATPCLAVDNARLLLAIAAVETGNNPRVIGRAGERGATQLMPWVRNRYGTPDRFLEHIEQVFRARGIPVTPHTCALAWNGGITAVLEGRIKPRTWNYACRVENLYNSPSFLP